MSPEAQRIAIATACGWKAHVDGLGYYQGVHPALMGGRAIPDYLRDLNAMHEAEKVLPDGNTYWEFIRILDDIVKHGPHTDYVADRASATAAQRAEAFLRTLGKWEGAK